MEDPTSVDVEFVWTPWGWIRLRSWSYGYAPASPARTWVSIQVQGTSISVNHGS
jgi:hypothetical protein